MRKPIVAGNWKMNGTAASARELAGAVAAQAAGAGSEVVLCPPHPYLPTVVDAVGAGTVAVGAQDVAATPPGAYTGEVAAEMLADVGCTFAIVGHSERRTLFGETDASVVAKAQRVLEASLTPILCVGETLEEREGGRTEAVVGRQLEAVLEGCGLEALARSVLAYEPVWAIGTGRTATPEQAQEVHAFLREVVARRDAAVAQGLRILYGGSVKAENASGLFSMPDIDGGLVGGASLDAEGFAGICAAAG